MQLCTKRQVFYIAEVLVTKTQQTRQKNKAVQVSCSSIITEFRKIYQRILKHMKAYELMLHATHSNIFYIIFLNNQSFEKHVFLVSTDAYKCIKIPNNKICFLVFKLTKQDCKPKEEWRKWEVEHDGKSAVIIVTLAQGSFRKYGSKRQHGVFLITNPNDA